MSTRRAHLGVFAGSVALLGAVACGSGTTVTKGTPTTAVPTSSATTGAQTVRVGTALTVETGALTVVYTVTKTEQKTGPDGYSQAPTNGTWLLVQAYARVTKGSTFVCVCDLSLIASDGKVYEQGVASFTRRAEFASATVTAGQHTDGWLFFDVPAKALPGARVQLKITSLLAEDSYGYWTL